MKKFPRYLLVWGPIAGLLFGAWLLLSDGDGHHGADDWPYEYEDGYMM